MTRLSLCAVLWFGCYGHGQSPSDDVDGLCGNGIVEGSEQCDDGNDDPFDGCDRCLIDGACGDGVLNANESCDDGNLMDGDGCSSFCQFEESFPMITASWGFQNFVGGQVTGCPTGFDTVAVTATPTGGSAPMIDLFDCSIGSGTIFTGPGVHEVHLDVTNATGTMTFATSVPQFVDVSFGGGIYDTTIFNDAGFFGLHWELRGQVSGNVLDCTQANVSMIKISSKLGGTTTVDQFPCTSGPAFNESGFTSPLVPGSYMVSFVALNAAQQTVGTAPAQNSKSITAPNGINDLGTVTFLITGM